MEKSNTQNREEAAVIADLIVPGTSSIVPIWSCRRATTLPLSHCGIRPAPERASTAITIICCANSWKRRMNDAPRIFAEWACVSRARLLAASDHHRQQGVPRAGLAEARPRALPPLRSILG